MAWLEGRRQTLSTALYASKEMPNSSSSCCWMVRCVAVSKSSVGKRRLSFARMIFVSDI